MSFKIDKLKIFNFKSIAEAEITLERGVNIFIGDNGSGKSNVLQFISSYVGVQRFLRLRYIRNQKINNTSYSLDLSYIDKKEKDKFYLSFEMKLLKEKESRIEFYNKIHFIRSEGKEIKYEGIVEYGPSNKRLDHEEFFQELLILRGIKKKYIQFNLPDDDDSIWVSIPNKLEIDPQGFVEIADSTSFSLFQNLEEKIEEMVFAERSPDMNKIQFENLRMKFFELFNDFKKAFDIDAVLAKYSPIQEIRLNQNINIYSDDKKIFIENLIVDFKIQNNWVSWSYLSDGSKRLFYLITETISFKKGILLIEEPELGIHPNQLFLVMNFLNEQSSTKQIIISTHSPIVLDILKPEELKNIVITKMTSQGTKLSKLSRIEISKAKEYMQETGDLSSYWLHSDLEKND